MPAWKNTDKIFIGKAEKVAAVTGDLITKDLLNDYNSPIDAFSTCVLKPCDNIELMDGSMPLMYIEQLSFYQDGSMNREFLFHRYPKDVIRSKINNHPMLTPWGQTIFDNAICKIEIEKERSQEEDW